MEVVRLAHAGLVVGTARARCLIDPVFAEPFEGGVNRFEPPVQIDARAVAAAASLVVLSHEHMDHFCVRSLAQVPRDRPVLYPAGAALIADALAALGFADARPVVPGQVVRWADLTLVFTPSNVGFPEVGVLIGADGAWFWNCVDTETTEAAYALVAAHAPRLDLMFANFQALAEEELACDGLGAAFPIERYAQRLRAVVEARPAVVVPASCGYAFAHAPWLDTRGFPIGEDEFVRDVGAIAPAVRAVRVPPGARIEVATGAIHDDARGWVARGAPTTSLDWRPDHGVAPLTDDDPYRRGTAALVAASAALLDGEFLAALGAPALARWRARLAAAGVVWQLDVVFPDGHRRSRWLDLAAPAAWLARAPQPPKLITAIAASTLVGLACGEATPYRALFTRRVVLKLYAPTPWGVERVGTLADEPVARVLFPGANRRFVDAELARLGLAARPPWRRRALG